MGKNYPKEHDRLSQKVCKMPHNLDGRGKTNWISTIRMKLLSLAFGFVWINQGVENMNTFVKKLKERLICVGR